MISFPILDKTMETVLISSPLFPLWLEHDRNQHFGTSKIFLFAFGYLLIKMIGVCQREWKSWVIFCYLRRNEFARGTTAIGSSLSNFVVHSLSWFHSKLLHWAGTIQCYLISHSPVTLKQVFSPGSLTPWQWSPLHSPDLHRRSTTPLPHAPCRAHSCHRRKNSGSGHAEASDMMNRDHQPPAPEREGAGPGCH